MNDEPTCKYADVSYLTYLLSLFWICRVYLYLLKCSHSFSDLVVDLSQLYLYIHTHYLNEEQDWIHINL
jgi:hypothetical protein